MPYGYGGYPVPPPYPCGYYGGGGFWLALAVVLLILLLVFGGFACYGGGYFRQRYNQQLAHTKGVGFFYIEYFIEISEKSRYNISVIEIFYGGII